MLKILNPVQESLETDAVRPARPGTLEGKRVGLYSNGKLNADRILQLIADELSQDSSFTIVRGKYSPQMLMAPDEWHDVDTCDVIILANGDCGACSSSGIANAISLEKRGLPAFLVSTPPFAEAVATMARLSGMPDIEWAIVAHPIGSASEAELRARATVAAAQFRSAMLDSVPAAQAA